MAKITNIIPVNYLGAILVAPRIVCGKIADIITAITEKGTKTQSTSIVTGVTLNTQSGTITTVSLTTAPSTVEGPFTVTNSKCFSDSVVLLTVQYGNGKTGFPVALVENITAGSFKVRIMNVHTADSLNDIIKINFSII